MRAEGPSPGTVQCACRAPSPGSHHTFILSSQPAGDKLAVRLEKEINSFKRRGHRGELSAAVRLPDAKGPATPGRGRGAGPACPPGALAQPVLLSRGHGEGILLILDAAL